MFGIIPGLGCPTNADGEVPDNSRCMKLGSRPRIGRWLALDQLLSPQQTSGLILIRTLATSGHSHNSLSSFVPPGNQSLSSELVQREFHPYFFQWKTLQVAVDLRGWPYSKLTLSRRVSNDAAGYIFLPLFAFFLTGWSLLQMHFLLFVFSQLALQRTICDLVGTYDLLSGKCGCFCFWCIFCSCPSLLLRFSRTVGCASMLISKFCPVSPIISEPLSGQKLCRGAVPQPLLLTKISKSVIFQDRGKMTALSLKTKLVIIPFLPSVPKSFTDLSTIGWLFTLVTLLLASNRRRATPTNLLWLSV